MSLWIARLLDSNGDLIGSEACSEGRALSLVSSSLSLFASWLSRGRPFVPTIVNRLFLNSEVLGLTAMA